MFRARPTLTLLLALTLAMPAMAATAQDPVAQELAHLTSEVNRLASNPRGAAALHRLYAMNDQSEDLAALARTFAIIASRRTWA